jgi:hypothetical protein
VEDEAPAAPGRITLESPAFDDGAEIPQRFTCDGEDAPPPLRWSGVPAAARELALVVEDPDAPDGTFVHWTVYGLPARAKGLDAGLEGENSFGDTGYGGPCPPEGDEPHRYEFLLYALSKPIGLDQGAAPGDVRDAIRERATARGLLTGTFGR